MTETKTIMDISAKRKGDDFIVRTRSIIRTYSASQREPLTLVEVARRKHTDVFRSSATNVQTAISEAMAIVETKGIHD